MKAVFSVFSVILAIGSTCIGASAAVGVYQPRGAGGGNGNSSLAGPFNTSTSSRLQQVYGAQGFVGAQPGEGYLIHSVLFKVDESARPFFTETFPAVQVHLSTSSRGPDGLSSTFSDNIGLDETVVFGRGSLQLSGLAGSFVTEISFSRPFLYDPSAGNLLLDIWNFGPGRASPMDAYDVAGDSVSIAVGRADAASGVISTRALATEFWVDFVPIPEPSTTALLGAALLALGWQVRRRLKI